MKEYRVTNTGELSAIAREVITILKEHKGVGDASVLALHGDLGAGKTTFMQALARELGVEEQVTSPTFVIMKKYKTEHDWCQGLTHIDAYRIEDVDEMRPLRFPEELQQKDTIIGIEWAEHIAALLPEQTLHLRFIIEGEVRKITIT